MKIISFIENEQLVKRIFKSAGFRLVEPTARREADQTQTASVRQRPSAKKQFDNKAHFRYLDSYWFRLTDASICCPAAEADTQHTIFIFFALKKQCLILYL